MKFIARIANRRTDANRILAWGIFICNDLDVVSVAASVDEMNRRSRRTFVYIDFYECRLILIPGPLESSRTELGKD
jgi:hypothetical protein